jgi:hypothetical protein
MRRLRVRSALSGELIAQGLVAGTTPYETLQAAARRWGAPVQVPEQLRFIQPRCPPHRWLDAWTDVQADDDEVRGEGEGGDGGEGEVVLLVSADEDLARGLRELFLNVQEQRYVPARRWLLCRSEEYLWACVRHSDLLALSLAVYAAPFETVLLRRPEERDPSPAELAVLLPRVSPRIFTRLLPARFAYLAPPIVDVEVSSDSEVDA